MSAETFDVLIVGAGLSGIGAAYHLQQNCPHKSYVILEGRESLGGTWDLFRYPGVRSDSDMYTLGYRFKPWLEEKAIADGSTILNYVKETAAENGIDAHIRYRHLVQKASWSSEAAAWTVVAQDKSSGETVHFKCNFLLMCAGYYSYKEGYTPEFAGRECFAGTIIHPQKWPEHLDYRGKKVVVIGSGATAVTLVPAMAEKAAHVVMLQRSPTYVVSSPAEDKVAHRLRKYLPAKLAYHITRWRNITFGQIFYKRTRTQPKKIKEQLIGMVRQQLAPNYDVETHFTPNYNPWDQRLCLVPDGDLFQAINSGKASVVTDQIETFTEQGIRLQSGQELEADIIVTATGLNLVLLGGIEFEVDGQAVDFSNTFTYKGMMYSNVPNLVSTFGYINASWTLRADLTSQYVCRLLNHMTKRGLQQCTPRLRSNEQNMPTRPWIGEFSSNYMQRSLHLFPKQGDHEPWINPQNYARDKKMIRRGALEDGALIFSNPAGSR